MAIPLTGQVALSGAAQVLSSAVNTAAFTIKAPATNGANAYIGASNLTTGTGYVLAPGESLTYETHNQSGQNTYQLRVSDFWALGTGGDVVTWFASP